MSKADTTMAATPQAQTEDELLTKIQELNGQAVQSLLSRMDEQVFEAANQALALAAPSDLKSPRFPAEASLSLQTLGRFANLHGDHSLALQYFQESLRIAEEARLVNETALTRSYIGAVMMDLGDHSLAAEVLLKAVREAEAIPNPALAAEILNDLSYNYILIGDPQPALQYMKWVIHTFKEVNDPQRLLWALETYGQGLRLTGQPQKALECVLECTRLTEQLGNQFDLIRCKQSAGELYQQLHNYPTAWQMFQEKLALARQLGARGEECSALHSIANLLLEQEKSAEAIPLLDESLSIGLAAGLQPQVRACYQLLSRAHKHLGQHQKALEFFELFYIEEKKAFNVETDQRLRNVQALYQVEKAKNEAEIYRWRVHALQKEVDERKRSQKLLEKLASTDPLTEVLNRRAFFEDASVQFDIALARQDALALILIDIDHFKLINDQYGHLVGDHVLRIFVERINHNIREDDLLARYGGEEFIVLLAGMRAEQALQTTERLREAVANLPITAENIQVDVSASFGVAVMTPETPVASLDQLVQQADRALYDAKEQGRNTVKLFHA